VTLRQYLRLWLGQAVARAFGRSRIVWFFGSILIGLALYAIPGLPDVSRVASWAVPLAFFVALLGPELVTAPYLLHSEVLANVQALERANELALAAHPRPMLIPVETSAPDADPVVANERDTEERVFAFVVENHGTGLAVDGVFQVVRKGIPGYRTPPPMVQFGQTRIGVVPATGRVRPKVTGDLESFRFIGAHSTPITDELTLEYQSPDGRWYQTIVSRNAGRWSDYKHLPIPHPSSREIDQAEVEARSRIGM